MKKIIIICLSLILLSLLIFKFLYENTSLYLYFNSNEKLIEKIQQGQSKDINLLTALKAIEEENNHKYDEFLLTIIKGKENLDWTLCQQCAITAEEYSNMILNKEYPGNNIPYLSYFNIRTQLKEYDGKYTFPINETDRIKILELLKSESNKSQVIEIINKINDDSINKWIKIINKK